MNLTTIMVLPIHLGSFQAMPGISGTWADPPEGFDGNNVAFMNAGYETGSVSQTVTLAAGTYSVGFICTIGDDVTLGVFVDGNQVDSPVVTPGDPFAQFFTPNFTVSAGTHVISFETTFSGEPYGPALIDGVSLAQQTSDIQDGGFEGVNSSNSSSPFWTFSGTAGVGTSINGGDRGYLDLPSQAGMVGSFGGSVAHGAISQDVSLAAGTYILDFDAAASAYGGGGGDGDDSTSPLDVYVGATELGTSNVGLAGDDIYHHYLVSFTISTPGTYSLSFRVDTDETDGGYPPIFIDNVVLYTADGTADLGPIVAAERIVTSYNTQGLVDHVTSYDEADAGNVVSDVQRNYNGFGQVTAEYQQAGAMVTTSGTSPSASVLYTYATDGHGSRLTAITYPNGSAAVVKKGSNILPSTSGAMPWPASATLMATKSGTST